MRSCLPPRADDAGHVTSRERLLVDLFCLEFIIVYSFVLSITLCPYFRKYSFLFLGITVL